MNSLAIFVHYETMSDEKRKEMECGNKFITNSKSTI